MERRRWPDNLSNVKSLGYALVVSVALLIGSATAADKEDSRVRAKPTVVTVEATADRVKTDRGAQHRSVGAKIGDGFKSAFKGVVHFTGWMLNVDDDIPSKREGSQPGVQPKEQ